MHGIIFAELRKFVEENKFGFTWNELLDSANLSNNVYMPVREYPDAEAVALVVAASKKTGLPADTVLEAFGLFITPDLLKMYGHLVKPSWRTLDFIEHAEETIHSVVRVKNPGAKPPQLKAVRVSPTELVLHYTSERKMCGVARGIAKGVAKHYGEEIQITETRCMHKGAPECELKMAIGAAHTAKA